MAIESFEQYVAHALSTEAPPSIFIGQFLSRQLAAPSVPANNDTGYNVPLIRLQHAVEGLCTEAGEIMEAWYPHRHGGGEVDLTNLKEELGDSLYYIAIGASVVCNHEDSGLFFEEVEGVLFLPKANGKTGAQIDNLAIDSLALLDLLKKRKFYPRELDFDAVKRLLLAVAGNVRNLAWYASTTPSDLMEANVRKLCGTRYKTGFSTEAANSRDLDAEREAIQ